MPDAFSAVLTRRLTDSDENVMFARSQSQLARDNPAATGQRLTRFQAENAFGVDVVQRVLRENVVSLVSSFHEPANTFRQRRAQLGLDIADLANTVRLDAEIIRDAETPGKIVPIQALNKLCQALALDESVLSYQPSAGSDAPLGVRLRMLAEQKDAGSFSAATVMALADAAWVILKQMMLSEFIGKPMHPLVAPTNLRDGDFSYPAYEKGYVLAERTRRELDLGPEEPIKSVRALIEGQLNIPLIQVALEPLFSGAAIASGDYRGIVVNERGKNSDVAVRRMTLCHELAHLLWDPDDQLNKVIVDDYDEMAFEPDLKGNHVEMRANAFAISFLAPRSAVKTIVEKSSDAGEALAEISGRFGISLSPARYHVQNVMNFDTRSIKAESVGFESWIEAENLTIDDLPGLENTVPVSRRGMFAGVVAKAFMEGRISADTGAMCLDTSAEKFSMAAERIAGMWD